jgi:hypothetical protein
MKPPANLHPKLRNIVKRSQWPVTDRMMEMNKGSSGAASQTGSERSDSTSGISAKTAFTLFSKAYMG